MAFFQKAFFQTLTSKQENIEEPFQTDSSFTIFDAEDDGNNIIENGDFDNAQYPPNTTVIGQTKLVKVNNPGNSRYVMRQKNRKRRHSNEEELNAMSTSEVTIRNNSKYHFRVLIGTKNPEINSNVDPSKLISFTISNDHKNREILEEVMTKIVPLDTYDGIGYYQFDMEFDIDYKEDIDDITLEIVLGGHAFAKEEYFTNMVLTELLENASDFSVTDKLTAMLMANNDESYVAGLKDWKDLTNNGFDFTWENKPFWNKTYGYFETTNNKLKGVGAHKLIGKGENDFTIVIKAESIPSIKDTYKEHFEVNNRRTYSSLSSYDSNFNQMQFHEGFANNTSQELLAEEQPKQAVQSEENKQNVLVGEEQQKTELGSSPSALTIYGNQNIAFEVQMPNDSSKDKMYLVIGDKKYGPFTVFSNNTHIMFFTYDVENETIRMYYEDAEIENYAIPAETKIYPTSKNIVLGKDSDWNSKLYSLMFYKKQLTYEERKNIVKYVHESCSEQPIIDYAQEKISTKEKDKYNKNTQLDSLIRNKPRGAVDSSTNCFEKCITACGQYVNNAHEYNECLNGCKMKIPECSQMCDDEKYNENPICKDIPAKQCYKPDCPIAYKKDGSYIVFIQKGSDYAKEMNRHGEINYGCDKDKARELYNRNFPDCPIPTSLQKYNGPSDNDMKSCPYVLKQNNPCATEACEGVDWSNPDPFKQVMSQQCRKNVAHYCEQNHNTDPSCSCWSPNQMNTAECAKLRNYMTPSDSKSCNVNMFDIKDHNEMDKYIKKDKIPCWGCNLA